MCNAKGVEANLVDGIRREEWLYQGPVVAHKVRRRVRRLPHRRGETGRPRSSLWTRRTWGLEGSKRSAFCS